MRWSGGFVAGTTLELQPDVRWLLTFPIAHYSSRDRRGDSIGGTVSRSALQPFGSCWASSRCGFGVSLFESQGAMLCIGESLLWVGRPDSAWFLRRIGMERDYAQAKELGAANWDSAAGLGNEQSRVVLDLRFGSRPHLRCGRSLSGEETRCGPKRSKEGGRYRPFECNSEGNFGYGFG